MKLLVKGVVFLSVEREGPDSGIMAFSVGVQYQGTTNKILYAWKSDAGKKTVHKVLEKALKGDESSVKAVRAFAGDGSRFYESEEGITFLSPGDDEEKELPASILPTENKNGGFDVQLEVSRSGGTKRYVALHFAGKAPKEFIDGINKGNGTLSMIAGSKEKANKTIEYFEKYLRLGQSAKK